jgi:hypothetical protein
MKTKATVFLLSLVCCCVSLPAFADADDLKWVAQCLLDNKDEGQTPEVVRKYCECMNNKMSDNETRSITEWEKSHPKEEKACDAEAGWKK